MYKNIKYVTVAIWGLGQVSANMTCFVAYIVHPFLWTPVKNYFEDKYFSNLLIGADCWGWCKKEVRQLLLVGSPASLTCNINILLNQEFSHCTFIHCFGYWRLSRASRICAEPKERKKNWQNNKISGGPTESNWQSANPHWPEQKLGESQPPPRSWRAPRWFWQPLNSQKPPHKEESSQNAHFLGWQVHRAMK